LRTADEIPLKRFVDFLLSLRMDAQSFLAHLASLARRGASTSSHE
jgi:hypothetical protein